MSDENTKPLEAAGAEEIPPGESVVPSPAQKQLLEPAPAAAVHPHHRHINPSEFRAVAIALLGWLIPGMAHAMLRMWGRAVSVLLAVGFLVYIGAGMRGNLFAPGGDDAFARLGYAADLGAGSFYFVARSIESNGPDVSHSDGDYGTRFLATAGVLNLLAALHAYEAARGKKA